MATQSATPVDHVKHAINELELARDGVSDQARGHIDEALKRLRGSADDVGARAKGTVADWQATLEAAGEDLRVEFGRRAVRAQQNAAALSEISAEVRRRKLQLTD
jgi:hypothetical protein